MTGFLIGYVLEILHKTPTFPKNLHFSGENSLVAHKLFHQVKIMCMVMTVPENHETRAIHIKNTWGKKCNKLIFMTSAGDSKLNTVILPIENSRKALWNKTKEAFLHLHEHYLEDYDFFLKADDDKLV